MTVFEAAEILKKYISEGVYYVDAYDDDEEVDAYGFLFKGEYGETDSGYVFAVYDTENGVQVDNLVFPRYVDKATGEVSRRAGPPTRSGRSLFPKKIDVAWSINVGVKYDEPVDWTPELLALAEEYEAMFPLRPPFTAKGIISDLSGDNEDRIARIKECLATGAPIPEREYTEMD